MASSHILDTCFYFIKIFILVLLLFFYYYYIYVMKWTCEIIFGNEICRSSWYFVNAKKISSDARLLFFYLSII